MSNVGLMEKMDGSDYDLRLGYKILMGVSESDKRLFTCGVLYLLTYKLGKYVIDCPIIMI